MAKIVIIIAILASIVATILVILWIVVVGVSDYDYLFMIAYTVN